MQLKECKENSCEMIKVQHCTKLPAEAFSTQVHRFMNVWYKFYEERSSQHAASCLSKEISRSSFDTSSPNTAKYFPHSNIFYLH